MLCGICDAVLFGMTAEQIDTAIARLTYGTLIGGMWKPKRKHRRAAVASSE